MPGVVDGNEPKKKSSVIQPRYFKLDEVATYLNVSVPQVYAMVRSGELPAIKVGGRGVWRVDRYKLEHYLNKLEADTRAWAKAHPLSRAPADVHEEDELDLE
jgi:excisionase family DNA binding protein